MRRREFITMLGGAVVSWPLAARAQHERMHRVAMITGGSDENDLDAQANSLVFVHAMHQLGWVEGRNLRIAYFWGRGQPEAVRQHAADLAALAPDIVVSSGTTALGFLLRATRTVPIVFVNVADPVGSGFVDSLSRPGGNATGFMQFEYSLSGKWLEVLKQIAPSVTRAAVLRDADVPSGIGQFAVIQSVAPSVGLEFKPINMRNAAEMEGAIAAFASSPTGGLVVTSSSSALHYREQIIALAARHKLPSVYYRRYFTTSGGLMSYGPDLADQYRRAAAYVDRILKGDKPADLPVQAPTKYELVVNLKTAKTLGLEIPPSVLARADEVIE
jgi:putative tryptophan/tyrosine transport system substrate-binding protein